MLGVHARPARRAPTPTPSRSSWSSGTTTPARKRSPTASPPVTPHVRVLVDCHDGKEQAKGVEHGAARSVAATSSASSTPRTTSHPDLLHHVDDCLRRDRGRRRPGRRAADELPLELVLDAERPRVLLLVQAADCTSTRRRFIPLGGNTVFVRRDASRTGRRLGRRLPGRGLRPRGRGSAPTAPARSSRTTPSSRPARKRRTRSEASLRQRTPLEPGVPPGPPEGPLAPAAAPPAGARVLHALVTVLPGVGGRPDPDLDRDRPHALGSCAPGPVLVPPARPAAR